MTEVIGRATLALIAGDDEEKIELTVSSVILKSDFISMRATVMFSIWADCRSIEPKSGRVDWMVWAEPPGPMRSKSAATIDFMTSPSCEAAG